MRIALLGWDKINARKDVKEPSWFKFKHKFFDDSEFFDFSHSEIACWLYFLCEASKKNAHGEFLLSLPHANHIGKLPTTVVNSTIEKLKRLQMITTRTVRGRYAGGTFAGARQEEIRLEEKREEETPSVSKLPETLRADIGENLFNLFLARKVTENQWNALLAAYPDRPWVVQEINRAVNWEEANPQRKKKNFAAFITRWLAKGWDTRRIEANPSPTKPRIWGETENEKYARELQEQYGIKK